MKKDKRPTDAVIDPEPQQGSARIAPFVILAIGASVVALLVLLLMLTNAEMLVRLGLAGNLYYLVLVPLGLAVAAFLFGVLKSYATYSGQVANGKLELGGPVVGFLLVLILGFFLVPNPLPFSLSVFVHGEKGRQDLVLRNQGAILLDLGADRRRGAIGDSGQAYFPGIPQPLRGRSVGVALDAEGYEPVVSNGLVKLDSESVYVAVRRKSVRLTGYVKTMDGEPIAGATASVAGQIVRTDSSGFFQVELSGDATRGSAALQVAAVGYAPWQSHVTPGGNEITVLLRRVN